MDTESSLAILKEKLISLGAEEHELDAIISDVSSVIFQKALEAYFSNIQDPALTQILETSQDPQVLLDYVHTHKELFPHYSEESFTKIATDVWTDYFEYMEQQ
ncbi:MAG: hypothetical protein V4519_00185 [Patescibacteria group bacterium]